MKKNSLLCIVFTIMLTACSDLTENALAEINATEVHNHQTVNVLNNDLSDTNSFNKTKETLAVSETNNTNESIAVSEIDNTNETIANSETNNTNETIANSETNNTNETIAVSETNNTKETIANPETNNTKETIANSETNNTKETIAVSETETTETTKENEANKETESIPTQAMPSETLYSLEIQEKYKGKKLIALTFDDGPNPYSTPILLEGLAQRNVKATFFVLGLCVQNNPDIVKRIYNEGHSIGNHSYGHVSLISDDNAAIAYQINKVEDMLIELIGVSSAFFRPPYGHYDDKLKSLVEKPIVLWNIDPEDWNYKDDKLVTEHIVSHAKDGAIILLHDIYPTSVTAALNSIDILIEQGYTFVTVDELLRRNGTEPLNGEIYHDTIVQ